MDVSVRPIYCVILAPNAPEQNPVEDIWLKAKKFLRKCWVKLHSFALVEWLFTLILEQVV